MKDVFPELKGQGFFEILDTVYSTGNSFIGNEMPATLESVKGKPEQIFIDVNYQAIRDEQHNVTGVLVFAYDVTEQVVARKTIEESEKRFSNILSQSLMAIAILKGPELIVSFANEPLIAAWGKENIMGKPFLEVLPELKETAFPKLLQQVYTTGVPYYGYETKAIILRNEIPVETYFTFVYQPYTEADNTITGITIIAIEVTEQVLIKKQIEESAVRFGILADAMPQKMWTADEKGNVNYLNQQWFEYTHKSFEELKDFGWEKIIHPDDWNHNRKTWLHSIKTGNDFELEHRFLCYDGTYHWHLSRGVAQKDEAGKVQVWIGTHTDIDEQKKKEQQKDEFISIASHEMKTPLTTAKAYLQMLELSLDKEDETAILYAQKANQSVARLHDLITELLDVSKIQYGKLDYTITTFSFDDMIAATIENMQHISATHTIVQTGKAQQQITGDKDRLQQVVINLLNNAIKYSPDEKTIFLAVENKNGEIEVSVHDNGIGISGQHLEKIFDRYYRVEEHAIQFQGLGIGLFISYEIIQRHHGKIWAESELGKGSTFHFSLPVIQT